MAERPDQGLSARRPSTTPKAYVSGLVAALEVAAVGHETARRGGVLWLRPPD
ncbi:MAG TPA: hypothetical protein VGG83_20150 [Trebonia sp.]